MALTAYETVSLLLKVWGYFSILFRRTLKSKVTPTDTHTTLARKQWMCPMSGNLQSMDAETFLDPQRAPLLDSFPGVVPTLLLCRVASCGLCLSFKSCHKTSDACAWCVTVGILPLSFPSSPPPPPPSVSANSCKVKALIICIFVLSAFCLGCLFPVSVHCVVN